MKIFSATALLVAIAIAFPGIVRAQDQTRPDLSGTWSFNQDKSDDIAAIMRKARGGSPPGGGRHPGGRGGGGRGGGMNPGNRAPAGERNPDQEELKQRALQARREYQHFQIFQEGDEFDLTNGLDITQSYFTDGRDIKVWTQQGETLATASWQGPVLMMRWQPSEQAPGRTRRFQLSEDGNTLTVTEERQLPGQDQPVKIRLVYDRQK
jgi:hypothetical protein